MGQVFMEGFLLQASLIFALGAQNIFVLESGLRRHHHITVSVVCFLCDFVIIMMGVIGLAALLQKYPEVKIIFGISGIAFLGYYGLDKIFSKDDYLNLNNKINIKSSLKKSILGAISFSVINPHAYLDGIVLIGGYSTKFVEMDDRLLLGLGASIYSLVWFLLLSSASSTMLPLLKSPRRMRLAMSASGLILVVLSLKLGVDVYGWVVEFFSTDPSLMSRTN